jgi:uncharacterized protein (DUF1501 family)
MARTTTSTDLQRRAWLHRSAGYLLAAGVAGAWPTIGAGRAPDSAPGSTFAPGEVPCASTAAFAGRTLVLVHLDGGNDGLNTVIPTRDPLYGRLRPTIGVDPGTTLALTDRLGMHPAMTPLMPAWEAQDLAICLGVGYPAPNRSHFTSLALWESGADGTGEPGRGWLASVMPGLACQQDWLAPALVTSREPGPALGLKDALVMDDPIRSLRAHQRVGGSQVASVAVTAGNPALAHVLEVRQRAHRAARALTELAPRSTPPGSALERELALAAALITSSHHVPVIRVSHTGYDTHAAQPNKHAALLGELAGALAQFRDELRRAGRWEQVLVMTYSEFGRRAGENASRGTDHGTSAPQFVMGGRVRGGLYNEHPSLGDLLDQDLRTTGDYRRLYATVIRQWWGVTHSANPFAEFQPLPLLRV